MIENTKKSLVGRADLTLSDVTICKGAVEMLAKVFSVVRLVVGNIPNLRGRCQHRAHTAEVGHVTSTRYSILYTAPYYPL